jgi:hypothetical protein
MNKNLNNSIEEDLILLFISFDLNIKYFLQVFESL